MHGMHPSPAVAPILGVQLARSSAEKAPVLTRRETILVGIHLYIYIYI